MLSALIIPVLLVWLAVEVSSPAAGWLATREREHRDEHRK